MTFVCIENKNLILYGIIMKNMSHRFQKSDPKDPPNVNIESHPI